MSTKLLLLLSFACILSCNAKPIEEKNGKTIITLKVYNLPDPESTSFNVRADLKALESFKKDFPEIFATKYRVKYKANPKKYGNYNWDNIEIKFVKYSGKYIKGDKNDKKFLASENAPDILYVNFRMSCSYIKNNFLLPLDEYYKTLTPKQVSWRVNPKIRPVARRKGPDGKTHWWTMPYDGLLGKAIVFRKDVFDKLKIPYPDKDWNWNDFMQICKKTTDISKNKYALRLGSGPHEAWYWTTFLWSAGGEVAAYNKKTEKWEYAFNSDAAVNALDFYTRLCMEKHIGKDGKTYRGYVYKNFKNANDMWKHGDIAMVIFYIEDTLITTIDLKNHGIVPVPVGPTGIRGSELNNRMFGINSQIKDAAIKDAAWEYILYYDSSKSQKIKIDMLVEAGMGHLINPVFLKKYGYGSIAEKVDKKLVETLNIAIATGVPEPYRAISSGLSYDFMTYVLRTAAKLAMENKLAPVGSKARYKQLKLILNHVCAYANKVNDKQWQELKKK